MRIRKSDSGTAVVELALLTFLLGAVLFGAIDFARVFYHAVKVADGARAGAQWAMRSHTHTVDFEGMQQAAHQNSTDIDGVAAEASRECRCADGYVVNCQTAACGEGVPQVYVRVRSEKTFSTLVDFPGVPHTMDLGQSTVIRVQ